MDVSKKDQRVKIISSIKLYATKLRKLSLKKHFVNSTFKMIKAVRKV